MGISGQHEKDFMPRQRSEVLRGGSATRVTRVASYVKT
jgi:hypothetical protein